MFEKITKALTPFGLSLIVIAGLTLVGRVPVVDRVILGYATIAVAASLIVVHVAGELKSEKPKQTKRKD